MTRAREDMRIIRSWADRIVGTYLDADDAIRAQGDAWYATESTALRRWADAHQLPHAAAIGAASAISPGMRWDFVLLHLSALAQNPKAKVPTYSRAFVDRANACLDGADPIDVLSGPKTRAFYRQLMAEGTCPESVVVDGHAFNIARGVVSPIRNAVSLAVTPRRYRVASAAYRLAGEELGVYPAAVQASTWIYWRKSK